MTTRNTILLIIFLSFFTRVNAQKYIMPLDTIPKVSGSFAELRSNHFHGGIDFGTYGKINLPIYAVADGYVSRISVSPSGYGYALYLNHYDGKTSVYGHLNGYAGDIAQWVEDFQYANETFSINEYLDSTQLIVKQGDVVAWSGNSGSSGGPHLHFELRETENQAPIDPLKHGYTLPDDMRPKFIRAYFYPLGDSSHVMGYTKKRILELVYYDGAYHLKGASGISAYGDIAFGIETVDYFSNSWSKCGLSKVEMEVDENPFFDIDISKFKYSQTRYINSMADFEEKVRRGRNVYRCYIEPGNVLEMYNPDLGNGVLNVKTKETKNIKINVFDGAGNKSELAFKVYGKTPKVHQTPKADTLLNYQSDHRLTVDDADIYIHEKALYKDLYFSAEVSDSLHPRTVSKLYTFQDRYTPIQTKMDITIPFVGVPDSLRDKLCMVYVDKINKWTRSVGGTVSEDKIFASVRKFGPYAVQLDTVKPGIRAMSIRGSSLREAQRIRFKISDNLSGIKSYEGRIGGKWVLFTYDAKNLTLCYNFDEHLPDGYTQSVELIVTDRVGNVNRFYAPAVKGFRK